MGGGNKAEKQNEERLRRQQEERDRAANAAIVKASAPDPLEERLKSESTQFLDWESGKSGPVDITKAPGMGPYLDLYNRASQKRTGERFGIGALKMGLDQSNPELAARIAEQREGERQQDAAGGLENAYRMKSAEVRGSAMPLMNFTQGRNMGIASLSAGRESDASAAYTQYLMRPKKPGFWGQLLGGIAGGAGSVIGAGVGAGGRWSR